MKPYQSIEKIILIFLLISTTTAQEDSACDGVTCSNKGTCKADPIYSRGYWCNCDKGWAGQDCIHPEPDVQCLDDRIEVLIDRGLVRELEIEDNPRYVYFGKSSASPQCQAVAASANLYKLTIRAPYSSCGTQAIQQAPGDDYTFSNTVVWNSEVHNNQTVIRRDLMLLDFKCIYEDTYTVSGPAILPTYNVLQFATEQGQFEVRMRLYDDNSYAPEHEYKQSPSIIIGAFVYVQVELAHVRDSNLVVTMDRCFASQSSDPSSEIDTKHWLITDRCASEEDSTVQIMYNGEQSDGRFKFQMFKWRWSSDDVYLHCEVDICNKETETCTGEGINCKGSGGFRKKRDLTREGKFSTSEGYSERIVSVGPVHVEVDQEFLSAYSEGFADDSDDTTTIFLCAMFGLFAFVVLLVIAIMIRRRRLAKLQVANKVVEKSQRLTSLKFTTEAF